MEPDPKEKKIIIKKAIKPVELPKNAVIQYIKVNDKFNPKDINIVCDGRGKSIVVDDLDGRKAVAVYADSNRPNKVKIRFNRKKKKKGVLIAVKDNLGVIRIGWSLCNFKYDKYDQNFALRSALLRTKTIETTYRKNSSSTKLRIEFYKSIPESVKKYLPRFIAYCVKYYKSNEFSQWIEEYFGNYIPCKIKKEEYFPKQIDIKFDKNPCGEFYSQQISKELVNLVSELFKYPLF